MTTTEPPDPGLEVIVTHDIADFDALAAAVAAQKLYPNARLLLGRVGAPVAEFLGLHRDRYDFIEASELDQDAVTRVIVVDVNRAKRLRHLPRLLARIIATEPKLEVIVWDHHPSGPDDLPSHRSIVEPVGSATTLLVEALIRRGLLIESPEATLFAIGIHVDTGSLTFGGSTDRDAAALSWLMRRGAHLGTLNRYLRQTFNDVQREALSTLFAELKVIIVRGVRVGLVEVSLGVARLGDLASHVARLEDIQALFVLATEPDGAVHLVARSNVAYVDVSQVALAMGGGGHAAAAAATVRDRSSRELREQLLRELPSAITPRRVGQVMSSPVHTVHTKTPLTEVRDRLASWRVSGLVVLKAGKLAGVLSRRDLKRAERRGQIQSTAGHFMSAPAVTTTEETSVEDVVRLMEKRNIGRLPVMRKDRVVGIITRSDAVRLLYEPAPVRTPED